MAKRKLITWSIDKTIGSDSWGLTFGNLTKSEAEEVLALMCRLQGSRDHDPLTPAEWTKRFEGFDK